MRYINVLKRASGSYLYSEGVVSVQPGDKLFKISIELPGKHTLASFKEHFAYDNFIVENKDGIPQKAFMFREDAQEWKDDFEPNGFVRRLNLYREA